MKIRLLLLLLCLIYPLYFLGCADEPQSEKAKRKATASQNNSNNNIHKIKRDTTSQNSTTSPDGKDKTNDNTSSKNDSSSKTTGSSTTTTTGTDNKTSGDTLRHGNHTVKDCTDKKGTVQTSLGQKFCRLPLAECPKGWFPEGNFSTTTKKECTAGTNKECQQKCTCETHEHSWSNVEQETCEYNILGTLSSTCYATVTEIGCF